MHYIEFILFNLLSTYLRNISQLNGLIEVIK